MDYDIKIFVFIVSMLFIIGCEKDDLSHDLLFEITDPQYPTNFNKISPEKREVLQNEFESGHVTFSEIDSFGFVGWSYNDNFELRKSLHKDFFTDINKIVEEVKLYLFEKSVFTGINDTTILQPDPDDIKARFSNFGGIYQRPDELTYNSLSIKFREQFINGLEVINSFLSCTASANGVHHVFGHWYAYAYIPETDQVTPEIAKTVLNGRILTSYNGWGQELKHEISEEDLGENRKVIFPYINYNKLELRVCWEFSPSHWRILMDTSTGEILQEVDMAAYLL